MDRHQLFSFTIHDLRFTITLAYLLVISAGIDSHQRKTINRNGSKMTNADTQTAKNRDTDPENALQLAADYEGQLDEIADLVARVRHEINNPLTGVLGQAQLLLREDLNERARKRAETIEELAIRLRDVVAQLRQIQKPSNTARQNLK